MSTYEANQMFLARMILVINKSLEKNHYPEFGGPWTSPGPICGQDLDRLRQLAEDK